MAGGSDIPLGIAAVAVGMTLAYAGYKGMRVQDVVRTTLLNKPAAATSGRPTGSEAAGDNAAVPFVQNASAGNTLADLDPALSGPLGRLIAAAPGRVVIFSGRRSTARQAELWNAAAGKYPDPEVRDNWVARPGTSRHERGLAADLRYENTATRVWVHRNAAKYSLRFPLPWEPWHIEPA